MILQQICFDARRRVYFALTDAGLFQVPPQMGGWAQRSASAQATCTTAVQDPQALARFLGMISPVATGPGSRLGGCNCKGRR